MITFWAEVFRTSIKYITLRHVNREKETERDRVHHAVICGKPKGLAPLKNKTKGPSLAQICHMKLRGLDSLAAQHTQNAPSVLKFLACMLTANYLKG